jgi:hypothetical protein
LNFFKNQAFLVEIQVLKLSGIKEVNFKIPNTSCKERVARWEAVDWKHLA